MTKTLFAAACLLALATATAQGQSDTASGHVTLTVLPAHPEEQNASLVASQLAVKVDGKQATVTELTPVASAKSPLELVLLIDGSVRASLYGQASDIIGFVKEIPSNTQMAIAYMQNGNAALQGPLTSDAAAVEQGLHLTTGTPGSNGSPYFCLSELAKHWPSKVAGARRAVVMITDGVDEYERQYDPDDPNVKSAIDDSLRAGIVVYTIYWHDEGRGSSTEAESNAGQNLLLAVTQATGGNSYWQGIGNPPSLQPFFDDLRRRLRNEYDLGFTVPIKGKPGIHELKIKASAPAAKVVAPQSVYLGAATH
ncbi:MAG TPA: hypothetical protein VL986_06615 [Terracidiphilus sp.]|nr:hypothetical protein [Terracidiphilus sp.]